MADLWNTDDTDSTDKHRYLCIRLFPADLAEERRFLISENQRYPREILLKASYYGYRLSLCFPLISQRNADFLSAKISGICGRFLREMIIR
jgi:hypothetical protein